MGGTSNFFPILSSPNFIFVVERARVVCLFSALFPSSSPVRSSDYQSPPPLPFHSLRPYGLLKPACEGEEKGGYIGRKKEEQFRHEKAHKMYHGRGFFFSKIALNIAHKHGKCVLESFIIGESPFVRAPTNVFPGTFHSHTPTTLSDTHSHFPPIFQIEQRSAARIGGEREEGEGGKFQRRE